MDVYDAKPPMRYLHWKDPDGAKTMIGQLFAIPSEIHVRRARHHLRLLPPNTGYDVKLLCSLQEYVVRRSFSAAFLLCFALQAANAAQSSQPVKPASEIFTSMS